MKTGAHPLTLSQVLEDELHELHPSAFPGRGNTGPTNQVEEDDRLTAIYEEIHALEGDHNALCLSGGGIRSATFALGVIQGLARHKLLGKFQYLSTVSGGGYIGSWLSGWIKHNGAGEVLQTLESYSGGKGRAESPQVEFLREYSSYLNPQLGLTSADTWSLIATVTRNLILNWLILIPLLAGVVMLPRLWVAAADLYVEPRYLSMLLGAAGVLAALAIAYVQIDLPSAGNKHGSQGRFLGSFLIPILLGAAVLATYGMWGASKPGIAPCVIFATAIHFAGWLIGNLIAGSYNGRWRIRGLVAVFVVGVLAGLGLYFLYDWFPVRNHSTAVVFGLPLLFALYMLAGVMLVGLTSRITTDQDREWWARSSAWMLIVAVGWPVVSGIAVFGPQLYSASTHEAIKIAVNSIGGVAGIVSLFAGRSSKTSAGRRPDEPAQEKAGPLDLALKLAGPAFILFLLTGIAWVLDQVVESYGKPRAFLFQLALAAGLFGLSFVIGFFVNVNWFSLHAMYRNRLVRTFLGASRPLGSSDPRKPSPFTGFDPNDDFPMKDLKANRPIHVINIALNLVKGKRLAWQHRKAETFTVTAMHSGSWNIERPSIRGAYLATDSYGGKEGITLGTAFAISGAAASPNMGYHSSPIVTFLMTLFNARLGWWLANPAEPGRPVWGKEGPWQALRPLINEALGLTDDESKYVYLSDGGHFENLALYEMVVRRCKTIVVVDGGCDPDYHFDDLGNAVRKVRIDLGIPIEFGATPPMDRSRGPHVRHYAFARIKYSEVDPRAPDGWLIYIKPVLTGDEEPDVLNYAATHPTFPHESTGDQWFDEDQFESYRMLGLHSVEKFCTQQGRRQFLEGRRLRPFS